MKNVLLAVLSGILFAISWPVYGVPIFIFVAFVPLLMVEKNIRNTFKNTKLRILGLAYLTFEFFYYKLALLCRFVRDVICCFSEFPAYEFSVFIVPHHSKKNF